MSLWNQEGGGPKKFGNHCFRRTFLAFVFIDFKSGVFADTKICKNFSQK
jgi:hypothetical protein